MSDSARLYRGSLSPDEAVAKLGALVTQIDEIETVTLADAAGRVLAADLLAAQDLPATNNAAVDASMRPCCRISIQRWLMYPRLTRVCMKNSIT